ncbi:MAG: integral rane sensor signal transduction histidine kinase [Myxococcales bacterium]|nr:integral rane sensor signal transduction histidine kinase [Myxococcales bacterium]
MPQKTPKRRFSALYVIVPIVLAAAIALGTYGFRYAAQLAETSESSLVASNRLLGDQTIERIDNFIVDSDRSLFELVDLDVADFAKSWSYIVRVSPAIEAAFLLDEKLQLLPNGWVSKRKGPDAEAFKTLFMKRILPDLPLADLTLDQHKHMHREYNDRDYLISFIKKSHHERNYYVVLKVSLEYVEHNLFPEVLNRYLGKVSFCVRDERDRIRYGEPIGQPGHFLYEQAFPTTLYLWRLQMAPPDAARLSSEERVRRRSEFLLLTMMLGTILAGIGFLFYATWKESRANEMKSDFISNVSHELKTPLSLIRMFGELLAMGKLKSPEKGKEYADIITREAERLSRLIDNVLDFARMERGRVAYEFQPGRLDEVVERSLDVYRHRVEREGLKLTTKIDPDLPETLLDENAMTLLLLNLLENAVKYGKGEIAVYLTRQGNTLRLVVGDQGPGIATDEHKRIFERFYRTRDARGTNVRGSGIGLSLVKHIAEAHGGTVTVDSEPGKGAAFIVDIPLVERREVA